MSNLLQKASIITTPTAYDTGKILSVKPVQTYGPEIINNGDFNGNANGWLLESGITYGNNNIVFASASNQKAIQTQTFIVGKTYKVSVNLQSYTSGIITVRMGSVPKVITTNLGVKTWYVVAIGDLARIEGTFNVGVNATISNVSVKEVFNADFDFSRNSSATRVGSNGLIQDVASNLPRIDYTGGVGSWKFEPQRTNIIEYSENFSQSFWSLSGTGSLITANTTTAPNGLQSASTLTLAGVGYIGLAKTTNLTETFSFFVKYSNSPWVFIEGFDGADKGAWFNIQTGNIGSTSGGATANIEEAANGFYRCSITATFTGATTFALFQTISNGSFTRANGDVIIWGAQLEVGSYPTSYIRSNSGSATTRLADVANNAGSSDLINSTQGVLYAEIAAFADDLTSREINISDGSLSNTIAIIYNQPSNNIRFLVRASATTYVDINIVITDITISNKVAFKYKENSFSAFINGFELGSDNSGLVPTGNVLNELSFTRSTARAFYGNTKCVAVFKEALTDLELECLSSWMSFSDLGINFGYTVE